MQPYHYPLHTKDSRRLLDFEKMVGFNATLLANKMSRGLTKILRSRFSIGVVEWRVMVRLANDEPLLASDIGKQGAIDKGLVSKAFKSLEAKELITTTPMPNRSRFRLARLTAKGVALHDEIVPLVLAREATVVADLTTEEIDWLFETLAKIRKNLERL